MENKENGFAVVQFSVADRVEYRKEAIVSSEVVRNAAGTITIFAFDGGQGLSEHTAPFDAVVQVVDGMATVRINGVPHEVHCGEMIIMPANVPHALSCNAPFKMVLTMLKGE